MRYFIRTYPVIVLVVIVFVVLGIGRVLAFVAPSPVVTACYSFDGNTVETTYLDGGGAFYPGPSDSSVEQDGDGFRVVHRTVFTPLRRVWVPLIQEGP